MTDTDIAFEEALRPADEWNIDTAKAAARRIVEHSTEDRAHWVERARESVTAWDDHLASLDGEPFTSFRADVVDDLRRKAIAGRDGAVAWLAHQEALLAEGVARVVDDRTCVDVPAWVIRELAGIPHPTDREVADYYLSAS